MEKQRSVSASIRLHEQMQENQMENLYAYVVDAGGKIIEAVPFKGREAMLQSTRENLEGDTKIYIAQGLPRELRTSHVNETTLVKAGAYNVVKNFNANYIDVFRIPESVLVPFPFHFCLIKGNVNKWFNINGEWKNLPLCDLRVHICEVETELIWPHIPIYYRRIPDWVIVELSEKIKQLAAVEKPVLTPPRPVPGPGPDPAPFTRQMKFNLPLRDLKSNSPVSLSSRTKQMAPLASHVTEALSTSSVEGLRKAFIDYHELLYPYFCLWPIYWPYIYCCHEEAVVKTDCNGNFEWWEFVIGNHSHNIYIWVEAFINGSWQTVYKPAIPCRTWWNYQCNTNINITITDPRVHPCDCSTGGPVDAVWFRSIGYYASALHIEQNVNSTISLQGSSLKNGGCTDIIYGQKISPFGSGLTLKLFCGANIFAAGVTHYRWKKTMVADANQNPVLGSSSIITGNVFRPYLVQISASHYETHYCALGAEGSGTDVAYRIPHHDVTSEPVSSLQDAADTARNPEWLDQFFDSANLDSHSLTDGVYKFELELLKRELDGSFTLVPVNKQTFQVSEYNTIGNSQDAPNAYLNIHSGDITKADSFKMNVRIDNAACNGDIVDAELTETGELSGPCGFIHYDNTGQHVHISFEATHPRNFARFDFGIVKGNNTIPTGIHPSGYVISGVDGFGLSGGIFSKNFTVLELLNGCPGQAAFSENLHVEALATDGTNRLYGFDYHDSITNTDRNYDAYDTNAFALSNS